MFKIPNYIGYACNLTHHIKKAFAQNCKKAVTCRCTTLIIYGRTEGSFSVSHIYYDVFITGIFNHAKHVNLAELAKSD